MAQIDWSLIDRHPRHNGCWRWLGKLSGADGRQGRPSIGTRAIYERLTGYRPQRGEHLLHSCDHPLCVNPDHLRIGTSQDNAIDRNKRGRLYRNNAAQPVLFVDGYIWMRQPPLWDNWRTLQIMHLATADGVVLCRSRKASYVEPQDPAHVVDICTACLGWINTNDPDALTLGHSYEWNGRKALTDAAPNGRTRR